MQHYFGVKKNNNMILNNDDIYHIKKVMRMHDNDNIVITENEVPYLCEIKKDNMPKVRLIVPLIKEAKMDLILQKSTEMGVFEIIIFDSKRSMVKEKNIDKKLSRWCKIVKEASEQSFRTYIPKVKGIYELSKLDFDGLKIVCSTKEVKKNVKNLLKTDPSYDTINLVVGPEGGLDEKEENLLNKMGYVSTTLGPRILRVETVPLFILSIINYIYME